MIAFLVHYDRQDGDVELRQFHGASAHREALQARLRAEKTHPHLEHCVLMADSEATIRVTHSRYFMRERRASD